MLKGQVGMRIEIWSTSAKMEAYSQNAEMKAALEAQMKGTGMRMLRQVLCRMLMGEAGMRLETWRGCMKDTVGRKAETQADQVNTNLHCPCLSKATTILSQTSTGKEPDQS